MRHLLVACVLVIAACAAQGLPIDNGNATGGGGGGGTGTAVDMARPRDLGGTGATCKTACDCQAGLACRQGTCGMSQIGPVYCCDEGQCPAGQFCQDQMGGFGQCGTGGGGGGGGGDMSFNPDGGIGMFCGFIPCTSDSDCKQLGCARCGAGANGQKVCAAK